MGISYNQWEYHVMIIMQEYAKVYNMLRRNWIEIRGGVGDPA
jgi:hypothetical protein